MQGLALKLCNTPAVGGSHTTRYRPGTLFLLALASVGFWAGPVAAQVVDDPFVVTVQNETAPSAPEISPGYVPDGSFEVVVTDGASCIGTTYDIAAAPVAASSPLGNTPSATIPNVVLGATAAGSPYVFTNAGAGDYTVTVTETGECLPAVNPEVVVASVPDAPYADLAITKLDSRDPIKSAIGAELVYTITVTNNGPSDVTDAVVTDVLPSVVDLKSTSGCLNDPSAVPTCDLGAIAAGNSASYDIVVALNVDTALISNTASVASSIFDPDLANNAATQETSIVPQSIPSNTPLGLMLMVLLLGGFGWMAMKRR